MNLFEGFCSDLHINYCVTDLLEGCMEKDLDIASLYDTAFYEVVDERTHKYSSTDVHESTDFAGNSRVSSNVSYHSDQNVWVKDVETGKERKFSFNSYNISVRPGHKILCAWNKKTSKLERVINLTTDTTYAAGGVYNDWTGRGKMLKDAQNKLWLFKIRHAIFSLFSAAPFLGTFLLSLLALLTLGRWGSTPDAKVIDERFKFWGKLLFVLTGLSIYSSYNVFDEGFYLGVILYLAIAVGCFKYAQGVFKLEHEIIKQHSNALDHYLQSLISLNRNKWQAQEKNRSFEAA